MWQELAMVLKETDPLSKTRSLALAKTPFSKREGGGKERVRRQWQRVWRGEQG